jgi:hypothetical protein
VGQGDVAPEYASSGGGADGKNPFTGSVTSIDGCAFYNVMQFSWKTI